MQHKSNSFHSPRLKSPWEIYNTQTATHHLNPNSLTFKLIRNESNCDKTQTANSLNEHPRECHAKDVMRVPPFFSFRFIHSNAMTNQNDP